MKAPEDKQGLFKSARDHLVRGFCLAYRIFILPRSENEDRKRRERIFNTIATTMIGIVCLLELFVAYAEFTRTSYTGFHITTFSFFIIFFGGLLALSRKGHTDLASYLFIGVYFLGATYGIYAWGIELPLSILSYAVIIVISSTLVGTWFGLVMACVISITFISIGYLETTGKIVSNLAWRSGPLEWKDSFEGSFFYFSVFAVSWLSNKDLEKSLKRARLSEEALKKERDLLEAKVEERTRELKAAQVEKVSQLYRFVEFGKLSSGIFHDLLNPLTTVSLTVERLSAEAGEKSDEYKENIDRAIRASKKIETFVSTVKKQLNSETKVGIFALENEVKDAMDLLLHKSRRSGVIMSFESEGTTLVYGNSVRFFQIAVNLISNAIDSYQDLEDTREKIVRVRIFTDETGISFQVEDFGCGIKPELQQVIFDPFFTTKSKQSGLGLGLSTTKDIAEKDLGGSITVRSEEGKGSLFTVKMPLEKKAEDRRRKAKTSKSHEKETLAQKGN